MKKKFSSHTHTQKKKSLNLKKESYLGMRGTVSSLKFMNSDPFQDKIKTAKLRILKAVRTDSYKREFP